MGKQSQGESLWGPLRRYVPKAAFGYVEELLNREVIYLKVTRPKKSRAGLYFYDEKCGRHVIYINGNLDRYNFLITLVHEYAHLVVRRQYGKAVKPHGVEWKRAFAGLMRPLLRVEVFPEEIVKLLALHMRNPMATHFRDQELLSVIKKYQQH
ncbi:SprT-like domain-containing protein [Schleiferia thermophila]|uniref:SprT-like domain-containing protein n=1 Tax=Schleiferia thermophila TaxID=884107 RepID=A0A368ZW13_9FLAO|nr:SprT-like domain-containing protein [Schleiferia thermophila]RCX01202.1 hypothetical protein DES35_10715 [Schleiferia thermophila]